MSLQDQIRALRPVQKPKNRASLLYDSNVASDMSVQDVYHVAMSSFTHLTNLNPHFVKFESSLFKAPSQTEERELLSKEENDKLDSLIGSYLNLLSPYVLLVPSASSLEYLIRKFEIHERNVTSLLECVMPFHETAFFGKVVSLIRVSEIPVWKWLLPTSKAGAPLSRKTLIDAMLKDNAVLQFVLDMASKNGDNKGDTRALMTFYGVTITSMLSSISDVSSALVRLLIPNIFKGLKSLNSDFRNATHMVILELAVKVKWEDDVLDALTTGLTKNVSQLSSNQVTKLLVLIFQSQNPSSIPNNAFKFVSKVPLLVENLKSLSEKFDISVFLKLLFDGLINNITGHENYFEKLKSLLIELPSFSSIHVNKMTVSILKLIENAGGNGSECERYGQVLSFFSARFPKELDAGIVTVLNKSKSRSGSKRKADDKGEEKMRESDTDILVHFLSNLFAHSRHAFTSNDHESTTLSSSLFHPTTVIRIGAVKELKKLALQVAQGKSLHEKEFVEESLLACLSDENLAVVSSVLEYDISLLQAVLTTEDSVKHVLLSLIDRLCCDLQNDLACSSLSIVSQLLVKKLGNVSDSQIAFLLLAIVSSCASVSDSAAGSKAVLQVCLNQMAESSYPLFSKIREVEVKEVNESINTIVEKISTSMISDSSLAIIIGQWVNSLSSCKNSFEASLLFLLCRISKLTLSKSKGDSSLLLQCWSSLWKYTSVSRNSSINKHNTTFLLECLLLIIESEISSVLIHEIFTIILSESIACYPLLDKHVQMIFSLHLRDNLIESLINIYTNPSSSSNAVVRSLDILYSYLQSFESLSSSPSDITLVSLMMCLCNSNLNVRTKSLAVLSLLGAKCDSKSLQKAVSISVESRKNEFLLSETYLKVWLSSYLKEDGEVMMEVITNLLSRSSLCFDINLLIEVMCSLADPPQQLGSYLATLLSNIQNISANQGASLQLLLKKVLPALSHPIALKIVNTCLTTPDVFNFSPLTLSLQAITPSLWKSMKAKEKVSLFNSLLNICERKDHDSSAVASNILSTVVKDTKLLVDSLSECNKADAEVNSEWLKRVGVLVEVSTSTASAESKEVLPCLFQILDICVTHLIEKKLVGEDEALSDYLCQSILSAAMQFADSFISSSKTSTVTTPNSPPNKKRRKESIGGSPFRDNSDFNYISLFNTDLIVSCICGQMGTLSTHSTALTLLSSLAILSPTDILTTLLPVLNNISNKLLITDDDYTYNMMDKVIELIVPSLINKGSGVGLESLLKLLLKSFLVIPSHRRLAFFSNLVNTLGHQHLQAVIVLLLSMVLQEEDTQEEEEEGIVAILVPFCHSLCHTFSPQKQIFALQEMLSIARGLPSDLMGEEIVEKGNRLYVLTEKESSSTRGAMLCLRITQFIANHLSTKPFLLSLLSLSSSHEEDMQKSYLSLCQSIFLFLRAANIHYTEEEREENESKKKNKKKKKSMDDEDDVEDNFFWQEVIKSGYDILEQLNQLLSITGFLETVKELLGHEDASVRRRALQMFSKKIEEENTDLSASDTVLFLSTLDHLLNIIKIKSKEDSENKQLAVKTIHLLCKYHGSSHTKEFSLVLPVVVDLVSMPCNDNDSALVASYFLCLATLVQALGNLSIPFIPKFMPSIVKTLHWSDKYKGNKMEGHILLQTSLLACLSIMTCQLASFISPYLSDILNLIQSASLLTTSSAVVLEAIVSLRGLIADHIPARLLLTPLFSCYNHSLHSSSIQAMFNLVSESVANWTKEDITLHHTKLFKFFILAFEYRQENEKAVLENVNEVEGVIVESFLTLVMKLNESQLKPLFLKLTEWAQVKGDGSSNVNNTNSFQSLTKCWTFYNIINALSDNLRSLFVPYFGYILRDAAVVLKGDIKGGNITVQVGVLRSVTSSLLECFSHDNDNFMDKARFDIIVDPLLSQIDNLENASLRKSDVYKDYVNDVVVPCIGQLACACGKDVMWKPLHYQLLLKTRSELPKIRLLALKAVQSCFTKVGDEYLIMLPETISFMAELLEDDDKDVEALANVLKKQIEELSGEKLDSYLTN